MDITSSEEAPQSSPETTRTPKPDSESESIPRTEPGGYSGGPLPFDPLAPGALRAPRTPVPPALDQPTPVPALPSGPPVPSDSKSVSLTRLTRRRLTALAVAGSGTALLLFGWYLTRSSDPGANAAEQAAALEDQAERPPLPCRLLGEPRKLADAVYLPVPFTSNAAAEGRIALAYAASATDAVGLTLDPLTLDAAQAFSENGQNQLFAVASRVNDSELQFVTSRANAHSSGGGLVELRSGWAHLNTAREGLKVQVGNQAYTGWPELGEDKSTSPRAEAIGAKGAIVTVRRGGLTGDVLVGMLDELGRPQGSLAKIASAAQEFGTPSVSVGENEVLLSFSSRASTTSPWRIELARAPIGQLPAASRPFVPEGLSDTAHAISPAAAPLPGGGWLLQWTVGDDGKHQVWVQVLDRVLSPIGSPLRVGPDQGDCGQGTPWAGSNRNAATFYVVRTEQRSELWGTALECPR